MTAKEKILYALETHSGEYLSGEELAENLGITRAAVWKAIRSLGAEGYRIDAVRNRGYRLVEDGDRISEAGIRGGLYCTRAGADGFHESGGAQASAGARSEPRADCGK